MYKNVNTTPFHLQPRHQGFVAMIKKEPFSMTFFSISSSMNYIDWSGSQNSNWKLRTRARCCACKMEVKLDWRNLRQYVTYNPNKSDVCTTAISPQPLDLCLWSHVFTDYSQFPHSTVLGQTVIFSKELLRPYPILIWLFLPAEFLFPLSKRDHILSPMSALRNKEKQVVCKEDHW